MGCASVRSDDTNSLKSGILHLLNFDVNIPLSPAISVSERLKAVRGYQHPVTARLLTPIEYPANNQ